jgi:hypothetical protein
VSQQVHLIAQTPNVRTAWIDEILLSPKGTPQSLNLNVPLWPRLQRIFIGKGVRIGGAYDNQMRLFLTQLPLSLTEIVIHEGPKDMYGGPFLPLFMGDPARGQQVQATIAHLPNLKKVSLRSAHALPLGSYRSLLRSCLGNGILQELELHPFPWKLAKDDDNTWFASESINLVGMSGFAVDPQFDNYEAALESLGGRFPNLRTLDVDREPIAHPTLAKMIKGGVSTIYHVQGAVMTDLKDWARSEGADVIHGRLPSTAAISAGNFEYKGANVAVAAELKGLMHG